MGMNFVLKETLESINISANQLAVESKIRSNTVYDMVNNKSKRVEIETLESIISALNKLAPKQEKRKKFNVEDVMIWVED